jgi:mycothiol synthase
MTFTARDYENEHDLQQMQDLLMAVRAETNDWRYPHVGDLMWNFFMLLAHLNPREHVRLWHDSAGRLTGYALLSDDPSVDFQVLPELEGTEVEVEALAWAEMRLLELRALDAKRWGSSLATVVRQDNTRRIAFLEQHGFKHLGEWPEVNYLRSLDEPIPAPVLPAGYVLREVAGPSEAQLRANAERDVWLPWPVGNISGEDYARLMRLPGYQRDLDVVVIAPDGIVASYVNGWIDPLNKIGDFGPVGTHPAHRRLGLSRAAQFEGLRRMQARGMNRVILSTGVSNTAARPLYESIGFRDVNRTLDFAKGV